MAKVKLTAARIESFKCPDGKAQAFLWDSDVPGLAVRATKVGSKSFVYQAPFQGADIRLTIGGVDVWPLNNRMDRIGPGGKVAQPGAREEARRLQALIDSGRDPREVRAATLAADIAKREADQRQTATVSVAWDAYLADRKPHWGARHYQDHKDLAHAGGSKRKRGAGTTMAGPLSELMGEKLSSLTQERLERWAAKEAAARPARARLGLRLVKAFLKWCSTNKDYRDTVTSDAASSKRIREKLGTPTKRTAVLQREQVAAWFDAVQKIPNPVISTYLQFMLLVGPRPNEPLALRWENLNFQWNTLTIKDKVEGERTIGMTPYVAQLLDGLPRRNEWVFSSPSSKSGRLVEPGDAHDKACEVAGLPQITLQGLRRSFASLCEWIEVPAGISAQIQGHAPQGNREQNYIRRPVDLLRQWHIKIEEWILKEAGITFKPAPKKLRAVA